MAKRIAKFEKVSFEQFKGGYTDAIGEASDEQIREVYDSLKLPKRATKGSAGYDFYAPAAITLKPGETAKIPTGIRAKMEDNWVLQCYPRSGLGFKFRLQIMRGIFSQRSPMIQMKGKQWKFRQERDLCRESSWNMELR